jgi:hypothetical protein
MFEFADTIKQENMSNLTEIPDTPKKNFENASGLSFDDVRIHYNSDKPAQLQANAYTQSNVIQFGRDNPPSELTNTIITKIGNVSNMAIFYTRGVKDFHIEAWEGEKRVAIVNIETNKKDTILHTSSDEQGGRGNELVPVALKIIAKYHTQDPKGSVELPMGGGAVVKLMISKLSKVFGDEKTFFQAEQLRKERLGTKKTMPKTTEKTDLDRFNPIFLEEHKLHMQAILNGKYNDHIDIMSPLGKVVKDGGDILGQQVTIGENYTTQLLKAAKLTVTIPNPLFNLFAESI